jgi:hypothetical protein
MAQQGFGGGLAGAANARPTKRNPIMPLVMAWGGAVVAIVLGSVLAWIIGVAVIANLFSFSLVGMLSVGFIMFRLSSELKNFTNSPDFAPWMAFVPCLNIYFFVVKVPAEMTKAKQMAGVQNPTKSVVLYLFLSPFALASDLNDIAGP